MGTLKVRKATVADAPAIAHIAEEIVRELGPEASALEAPVTPEAIARRIRSYQGKGAMFVAMLGRRRIGFAALEPASGEKETLVLGVWVLAPYRRQGIGTQLALAAIEKARSLGAHRLRGTIPQGNEPALSFFGELGALAQAVAGGMAYELPI